METGVAGVGGRGLWLVLAITLLVRLPFLNQAIQGDDHIYLSEAEHALVDPLHPNHVKYVFMGDEVDLRGHPHPPGNAWALAGLLLIFGDVKEVPFHAAYVAFSLIAVWAMWTVARRFSRRPVRASLLFIAVPAFLVNGNSLEADLPFLAFWMASVALFTGGPPPGPPKLAMAGVCMAFATMIAYQAIFLVPILAVYLWLFDRKNRAAWLLLLVPPLTLAGWQIFTRLTTGALPAEQLAGYLSSYGFNALGRQLSGALMLLIHSWFLVFPVLVPFAMVAVWRRRREPETMFLAAWIAIFLACGAAIFFAGSARYLLPIAAPVAILAARVPSKLLAAGIALQFVLGLGLAAANYQHWDGYRTFAAALRFPEGGHRVWVDNDWGLRYYLEARGALPARKGLRVRPGDIIVSSELGSAVAFTVPLAPVAAPVIQPSVPLRLIGLQSKSGYSTVSKGFWPFGISTGPVDRIHARQVMERHPELEYVTPREPGAAGQIVSGVYPNDGWMSSIAVVALKEPAAPKVLRAEIYVPDNAKARQVTLLLDGKEVAARTLPGPGKYTIDSPGVLRGSTVEIRVDQTFRAPGDRRDLGAVLLGVGFM